MKLLNLYNSIMYFTWMKLLNKISVYIYCCAIINPIKNSLIVFLIQKWLANAEKSPYLTKTQVQTQSKYFGKQLFCPCIFSSVLNYA